MVVMVDELVESEGEFGVELEVEGGLKLVYQLAEQTGDMIGEGVLGSWRIGVVLLLQTLHCFLLQLAHQRTDLLILLFVGLAVLQRPGAGDQQTGQAVVALRPCLVLVLLLKQPCQKFSHEIDLVYETLVGLLRLRGRGWENLAVVSKLLVYPHPSNFDGIQNLFLTFRQECTDDILFFSFLYSHERLKEAVVAGLPESLLDNRVLIQETI